MSGAEKDYAEWPRKNHWRRGVWNDIAERVQIPRWSANILYLAGEQNMDAAVAASKGFDRRKMIAVEKDGNVLRELRSRGVNVIEGDLTGVLAAWPAAKPLDVIVGDFCCGLERDLVNRLLVLTMSPQLRGAVLMLNFMRGRDATSNKSRGMVNHINELHGCENSKHRGDLFFAWYFMWLCGFWRESTQNAEVVARANDAEFMTKCLNNIKDETIKRCRPRLRSYKSDTGQVFDSITFRTFFPRGDDSAHDVRAHHERVGRIVKDAQATRRRIAAAMAVKTQRLK